MSITPLRLLVRCVLLTLIILVTAPMIKQLWLGAQMQIPATATKRMAVLIPERKETGFEQVVAGLENPWGMAFLPDGRILVTEKRGEIRIIKNGTLLAEKIRAVPRVHFDGQGGLLDIALHPEFQKNNLLFLSLSLPDDGGSNTAILKATLSDNTLIDKEFIYTATPPTSKGVHFGSRLAFDSQHRLFFTIGDRGDRDTNPQDITRDGGKVYRIHTDGTIPLDNPFSKSKKAKSAIYSYGHRNPQGLAFNPITGTLFEHEHGPRGGDELNIIRAGLNYGWPVISYGINYDGSRLTHLTENQGMQQPETFWTPSIAPCGMAFVKSDRYPDWQGDLILGSLKYSHLVRVNLDRDEVVGQEVIAKGIGRVRNIAESPDGYIYVGVEGKGLFRLIPDLKTRKKNF